jgi:hypothetical protein
MSRPALADASHLQVPMTQTYTLDLDIDDLSLVTMQRIGARIVIAKPAGNARPNVVWLALDPAAITTIAWEERYGVYAATHPSGNGAPIILVASVYPADDRTMYPFTGSALGPPVAAPHLPRGHYDVRNDATVPATFGLLQAATVDGRTYRGPLNATALAPGNRADFTSAPTLYVWTQSRVIGGSIAPELPRNATIITVDPSCATQRYRFVPATASFAP